ncbi:MAG: hypothetical protein HY755_03740 [Nitrospirae bacterium]|nr:hypothetical protein [Nitrospirota bacterium]
MKKYRSLIITVIVSICFMGVCLAADKPEKTQQITQEKPKEERKTSLYHGVVGRVKLKAKTLEVLKENMDIGLLFDASQAKFSGYKRLRDVKVKDKVTVEYDVKTGKNIALVITKEK